MEISSPSTAVKTRRVEHNAKSKHTPYLIEGVNGKAKFKKRYRTEKPWLMQTLIQAQYCYLSRQLLQAHLKAVHTTRYARKVNFDEVYNDQRLTHTHGLSKRDDDLPAFAECGGGRRV